MLTLGLLAVLALVVILAAVGWFLGWSLDRVRRPVAATLAEAGDRTVDLAQEFWDWLRLGR